jgi:dienelactone hydrolase
VTRRDFLSASAAASTFCGRPLFSQSAYPGVAYREYYRCLPDYLRELARRAYTARNAALAQVTTMEALRKRQAWVRTTFWKLIGGRPEPTPLNARTVGSFSRDGYRVEKVIYESLPGFLIPANLYIPTSGQPPYPGVLFQMGHTNNGKAADTYQRCCQGLVKLGFLVLAFDPMGQGERVYYPDAALKRTRLPSSDAEHTTPGKQMLLVGDSAVRMQVWDAVRSLDYLEAHPLVDPKRLGSTGQSGGATQTMHLMAVDDRLAAVVECSGNTENVACANFNPPGSTDDAEQDLVYSGPEGFDRWDVFYPFAPKPLLVTVSARDFFGTYSSNYITDGWEEFQKLRKVYALAGKANQIAWWDTALPHSLEYDSRLQVYNWFRRHLKGETTPIEEEPPVAPEPDATLWVSESGNLLHSLHSETPFGINRSRRLEKSEMPLDRLLRIDRPPENASLKVLRRVPYKDIWIEAVEVASAPRVWVPAWLFRARTGEGGKPVLVALDPYGRNRAWHEGEMYPTLALKGYTVCVPDLRGIGDMTPDYPRGDSHHARSHQDEENYSWGSLILGKPLVGQRVTDVLALASALRRHPGLTGRPLMVAASGRMTLPALFAAALDPKIEGLYLAGGLVSYRSIVETEEYSTPLASFVPDVLRHTDLPDIVAIVAPRRVCLAGCIDAAGDGVAADKVRALYASSNVEVRARAQWDVDSLSL